MDSPEDMKSPEEIRSEIEETRASLTGKLESLETEVRQTVQGASNAVKDTVDGVKRTFDVRYQVRRHPWAAVGIALAAGLAAGTLLSEASKRQTLRRTARRSRGMGEPSPSIRTRFAPELESAKAMAIGAAIHFVGDIAKEAVGSSFRPHLNRIVQNVARKLGGDLPREENSTANGHAAPGEVDGFTKPTVM